MTREGFRQAATFFSDVAAEVRPDQWDTLALGEWSVRELVAHASRTFASVHDWASPQRTASRVEVPSPAGFYVRMFAPGGGNAGVMEQARESAQMLEGDIATQVRAARADALAVLIEISDHHPVASRAGGMRFIDWLATRTVELTVHGLDLAAAIGSTAAPGEAALRTTFGVLSEIAIAQHKAPGLLLALTGRHPLPTGFSLMAD